MAGGLIQLVAYGAQDVYLTSNPQITFFKIVYQRHTHFAMETIRQNFTSFANFGNICTVPITRSGDLFSKLWLRTSISTSDTLTPVNTELNTIDYYIIGSNTLTEGSDLFTSTSLNLVNTDLDTTTYYEIETLTETITTNSSSYIKLFNISSGVICLEGYNLNFSNFDIGDVIYIDTDNTIYDDWENYYTIHSDSDISNNKIIIKGNSIEMKDVFNGFYLDSSNKLIEVNTDIDETFIYDINSEDDVIIINSNDDNQISLSTISNGTFKITFDDYDLEQFESNDIINISTSDYEGYYKINSIDYINKHLILQGESNKFIARNIPSNYEANSTNNLTIYLYKDINRNNGQIKISLYKNSYPSYINLETIENGVIKVEIGNGINPLFSVGDVIQINVSSSNLYNDIYFKVLSVNDVSNITSLLLKGSSSTFLPDDTYNFKSSNTKSILIKKYYDSETFNWVEDIGFAMINSVELRIGGVKIDRHYGRFLHIWNQLTEDNNKDIAHKKMINCTDGQQINNLYIPLQFFCCRKEGLAIPLCALQYHEVQLEFEFNSKQNCVASTSYFDNINMSNTTLLVNYIFLDTNERDRFIKASHEYLIDQIQHTGFDTVETSNSIEKTNVTTLYFNHPIKEFMWAISQASSSNPDTSKYKFINFTNSSDYVSGSNPIDKVLLQLNANDRFPEERSDYFNYLQPKMHHTRIPNPGINVYSFCINPEEFQPSGSCNFSRIDNAVLKLTLPIDSNLEIGTKLYIFAIGYNVLRIMSGMGGLSYSN